MKNPDDLYQQEHEIRARAGQVMSELKARGEDWQAAWRAHPAAVAYRALLKRAWSVKHQPGPDTRYHFQQSVESASVPPRAAHTPEKG